MKRKEFKLTNEMKENDDFNFAIYVYENTEDAVFVNEDSLEFLDEKRNFANCFEDAVYFTMSYYEEEDEDPSFIKQRYNFGKVTIDVLDNAYVKPHGELHPYLENGKYNPDEYVLLNSKYDNMIVKIFTFYKHINTCPNFYSVITSNGCIINYVDEDNILRKAVNAEIKQYDKELKENENEI